MIQIIKSGYFIFEDKFSKPQTQERITQSYELELCTAGQGCCVIDGEKYPHHINRILLAKPNQKRYSIGRFECYYIHFLCTDSEFENKYLKTLATSIVSNNPFEILSIFTNSCGKHTNKSEYYFLYMDGAIRQLLSLLHEVSFSFDGGSHSSYQKYRLLILNAKDYLDSDFGDKLTLNSISSVANLSPNFFRIVFKELMGISPHQYLLNLRLFKAKQFLSNTDYLLSDIAVLCGFETQPYMNYVFRKYENTTPLQYRVENQIYI